MESPRPLPDFLFPAFEWTGAAGELDELARLRGAALKKYARESAENAREHEVYDVSADDIIELSNWLREDIKPMKASRARRTHTYYYKGDDFSFGPFDARNDDEAATMIEKRKTTMSALYRDVLRKSGYGFVTKDGDRIWEISPSGQIYEPYAKTVAPRARRRLSPR